MTILNFMMNPWARRELAKIATLSHNRYLSLSLSLFLYLSFSLSLSLKLAF